MATEDYVSVETAMLLKENGFDGYCDLCFNFIEIPRRIMNVPSDGKVSYEDDILREEIVLVPTIQMATKWLRENYGIHIIGVPNGIGENVFYMGIYRKYDYGWTYISDCLDEEYKEAEFHTPEEACEAAIKYCLENLI